MSSSLPSSTAVSKHEPQMDAEERETVETLLTLCIPRTTLIKSNKVGNVTQILKVSLRPIASQILRTSTMPTKSRRLWPKNSLVKAALEKELAASPPQKRAHRKPARYIISPIKMVPVKKIEKQKAGKQCFNCKTTTTSVWRRQEKELVCNACGLYYRLNKVSRPVGMRNDNVQTRQKRN